MANLSEHSKECNKCAYTRSISYFSKDKTKKDGYHSICKFCQKETKALRTEEYKVVRKAHYEKNKEQSSAYHKAKNAMPEVKAKLKEKHLKKTYNLSLTELEFLKVQQKYKCAICGTHEDDCSRKTLFVDHNHDTGEVRGLLCSQCNSAIGLMYDNSETLRKAAKYLDDNS